MNSFDSFSITDEEYCELEKCYGKLAKFASWQLIKKNAKNSHTDDFEDVNQEVVMSLIRAGVYYKRQVYIEKCLEVAKKHVKDRFMARLLRFLKKLWKNRTRHGANRQKYGLQQEQILDKIVEYYVPPRERPIKNAPLIIDSRFATYCKAIAWNTQKSIGRKITKEKSIRNGQVMLSDYNYLAEELV